MASRQEEKERRREERLAAERQESAAAARKKRLGIATGAVLALALVAAIVIVALSSGGSSKPKPGKDGTSAKLPGVQTTDLTAAAKAAGCTMQDYPKNVGDRGHTAKKVKYKTNPPAFGEHNEVASSDGDYVGQGTPAKENLVHSLEHGRVELQYRTGLPQAQRSQLESLFNEKAGPFEPGQYLLLFQNNTGMPYAVAATAWTHILGCKTFTPKVFDALRAFRAKYTLQAPEKINQPE